MTNKMTKVQMFEAIKAIVADNQEMVDFLNHEIALTEKRNSRKSTGMTKTQKENLEVKSAIVDALVENENMTATEVANAVGISLAKATALLTQLVKTEKVQRNVEKKVARFSVIA